MYRSDHSHSVQPPFFVVEGGGEGWRGGGLNLQPNFQKGGGGLVRTSTFRGGLLGKRGMQFSQKNLKSEIFNDRKRLQAKIFFSVITKNSN